MSPPSPAPVFNAERLRVYPLIFLAYYALSMGAIIMYGLPYGYDFVTFNAAAKLTLAGHAAEAFNLDLLAAAERAAPDHVTDRGWRAALPPHVVLTKKPPS